MTNSFDSLPPAARAIIAPTRDSLDAPALYDCINQIADSIPAIADAFAAELRRQSDSAIDSANALISILNAFNNAAYLFDFTIESENDAFDDAFFNRDFILDAITADIPLESFPPFLRPMIAAFLADDSILD